MHLSAGQYSPVLEFHEVQLPPNSRIGDTVRVTFFPETIEQGLTSKTYFLESQDMNTKIFTGKVIDYIEIAKTRVRKQVYF